MAPAAACSTRTPVNSGLGRAHIRQRRALLHSAALSHSAMCVWQEPVHSRDSSYAVPLKQTREKRACTPHEHPSETHKTAPHGFTSARVQSNPNPKQRCTSANARPCKRPAPLLDPWQTWEGGRESLAHTRLFCQAEALRRLGHLSRENPLELIITMIINY